MSTATQKPFTLYTAPTPNGQQVSVLLEELKAVNPTIDYEYARVFYSINRISVTISCRVFKINISTNVQKVRSAPKFSPGRLLILSLAL